MTGSVYHNSAFIIHNPSTVVGLVGLVLTLLFIISTALFEIKNDIKIHSIKRRPFVSTTTKMFVLHIVFLLLILYWPSINSSLPLPKELTTHNIWALLCFCYFWFSFKYLMAFLVVSRILKTEGFNAKVIRKWISARVSLCFEIPFIFVSWLLTNVVSYLTYINSEQVLIKCNLFEWIPLPYCISNWFNFDAPFFSLFVQMTIILLYTIFILRKIWDIWNACKKTNNIYLTKGLLCVEVLFIVTCGILLISYFLSNFAVNQWRYEYPIFNVSTLVASVIVFVFLDMLIKISQNCLVSFISSLMIVLSFLVVLIVISAIPGMKVIMALELSKSNEIDILTIISIISTAWVSALFITGTYFLPHSIYLQRNIPIDGNTRITSSEARVISFQFYLQCLSEYPIQIIMGLIIHCSVMFFPLLLLHDKINPLIKRLDVTIFGAGLLLITSLPMFAGPILLGYINRREFMYNSIKRNLHNRVLESLINHHVIIGFGNLGSIIAAKLRRAMIRSYSFSLTRDFTIVVDKKSNMHVVSLRTAIIDKDYKVFDYEYPIGPSLNVGLVSIREYVRTALIESEGINDDLDLCKGELSRTGINNSEVIYIPGICGEASLKSNFDLLRWDKAREITSTTDDDLFPMHFIKDMIEEDISPVCDKLEKLLEIVRHISHVLNTFLKIEKTNFPPPFIAKVNRGSTYRYLIRMGNLTSKGVLPIFPSQDEAENILKYACIKDGLPLINKNILVIGSGRRVFHFISALTSELGWKQINHKRYIENKVTILTDDKYIMSNMVKGDLRNRKYWKLYLQRYRQEMVNVPIIYTYRIEYDSIRSCLEEYVSKNEHLLIVAFAEGYSSIVEMINESLSTLQWDFNKKLTLLLSVEAREYHISDVSDSVNPNVALINQLHDEVVAAEIVSCMSVFNSPHEELNNQVTPVQIQFCEKDKIGALLWKCLVFSGLKKEKATEMVKKIITNMPENCVVPSFHYYFTEFPVIPEIKYYTRRSKQFFSFRSSINLTRKRQFSNYDSSVDKIKINYLPSSFSIGESEINEKVKMWQNIFGISTNRNETSRRECSTICPFQVERNKSFIEMPEDSHHGSIAYLTVICDGYQNIGALASMLLNLLLNMEPISFDYNTFNENETVMDLRFVKDTEQCGPGYTLATCYGYERKIDTSNYEKTLVEELSKFNIVKLCLEGKNPLVLEYAKQLDAYFMSNENIGLKPKFDNIEETITWQWELDCTSKLY